MSRLGDVHRFVAGTGSARTTLLVLHGTGGDENDLLPLGRDLAPEAPLLAPRGPVLEHGMPRFFRRRAVGVFDLEDLAERTRELAEFLDEAARRHGFARERVVALGYSNGANLAASLLLTEGSALAGAVLLRPMMPYEPVTPPRHAATPIFVAAGRRDPYASSASVERLVATLRAAGAEVELAWADEGHALAASELERVRAWLAPRLT